MNDYSERTLERLEKSELIGIIKGLLEENGDLKSALNEVKDVY